MNTTLYLDKKDIEILTSKYPSYFMETNNVLKDFKDYSKKINNYPKVENKQLIGLVLSLDAWKNLNKWIIEQTTEIYKPKFRDAVLTILDVDILGVELNE